MGKLLIYSCLMLQIHSRWPKHDEWKWCTINTSNNNININKIMVLNRIIVYNAPYKLQCNG